MSKHPSGVSAGQTEAEPFRWRHLDIKSTQLVKFKAFARQASSKDAPAGFHNNALEFRGSNSAGQDQPMVAHRRGSAFCRMAAVLVVGQTPNGLTPAPANPVQSTLATFTPDPQKDLFMNSGDQLSVSLHVICTKTAWKRRATKPRQ